MRFSRIQVDRFGRLQELDTGERPLPPLVVVEGPNEAGKTSLFRFLTSLLYGFYPASRDRNPYTPWSGGEIEGRAVLSLEDGEEWTVHRRLLSSGWGRLTRNGRVEDIRNQTLPCVDHVSLDLFQEVYALTLADLARLEGESWRAVQDRLMGAMGASDLRSAREAWNELESEADSLWRPDRRGKPRARELAAELRELQARKRDATERDRRLRDMSRTLREIRQDLQETRLRRGQVKNRLERVRTLLPVRRQLLRIDELREEASPEASLKDLPSDPSARLLDLRNELARTERRLDELERDKQEHLERIAAFREEDSELLDAEEEIRRLAAHAVGAGSAAARRSTLEQELSEKIRRIESQARELFSEELTPDELHERIREVPLGSLAERIRAYRGAAEERRIHQEALRWADRGGPDRSGLLGSVLLVVLGVVLMGLGLAEGTGLTLALGLAAAAGGIGLFFFERRRKGRSSTEDGDLDDQVAEARAKEERRLAEVQEMLQRLPLHRSLLEHPRPEVAGGMERLLELLQDREERLRALEASEREAADLRARLESLGGRISLEIPDDPVAAGHLLERALSSAESRAAEARAAQRELERLEDQRREMGTLREQSRGELRGLEDRLRQLGGGDLERGAEAAQRRLKALQRARGIEEELRRNHPDLDRLRERIQKASFSGESWTVDQDAVARAQAAEEALTDRVEALERRVATLETEIGHLRDQATPDEVESSIQMVREEIREVTRERDRKYVLAHLIREADRRFREEHQPDLVRRAGEHLESITEGRYRRLRLGEGSDGETFFLEGPEYPRPLPVDEPVSTGTREQVYLALRLAIVDHLDQRAETLPIFIDEAFVNWDLRRRDRGLDLLESLSAGRQIFVFTCHGELAQELEARGGRVLNLPEP